MINDRSISINRRPVRLFGGNGRGVSVAKSVATGRHFVDVPLILLACQQPNKRLPPESTWENFWAPRGPPGDPKSPPGDPQETPRGPREGSQGTSQASKTSNSHQTHIKLTANSQQTQIKLTANSHRTHREPNLYTNILSGVELPISRLWRPYVIAI